MDWWTLTDTTTWLPAEAMALSAAQKGQRVLVVGGFGSRAQLVAAGAAAQGIVTCDHLSFGETCSPECQFLYGVPNPEIAIDLALPATFAASAEPLSELIPVAIWCWYDSEKGEHEGVELRWQAGRLGSLGSSPQPSLTSGG